MDGVHSMYMYMNTFPFLLLLPYRKEILSVLTFELVIYHTFPGYQTHPPKALDHLTMNDSFVNHAFMEF